MSTERHRNRQELHARQVLADARRAIDIAREAEGADWRVAFAAAVSILRAVAVILYKVDARKSPSHKKVIDFWWDDIRQADRAKIYNEFVRKERDIILKEYEFRFSQEEGRPLGLEGVGCLLLENGGRILTEGVRNKILTGPWRGQSADRLLEDAYDWFLRELANIEEAIEAGRDRPVVRRR